MTVTIAMAALASIMAAAPADDPVRPALIEALRSVPKDVLGTAEGSVSVRLDFDRNGRMHRCTIEQSSGISMLDAWTCRGALVHFRAKPLKSLVRTGRSFEVRETIQWRLRGGALRAE